MRTISCTLIFALATLTACTNGDDAPDTDSDIGGTDATDDDTDATSSDDDEETDEVVETDEPDELSGTPVEMVNPSFEDVVISEGGDLYQAAAVPKLIGKDMLEIEGWSYWIGTTSSGIGVSRPTADRFGEGEPLAAPADGNVCGYLDARYDSLLSSNGASQLSSMLPTTVSTGQILRARVAFASRIDNESVVPHENVVLGVAFGDTSVASVNAEVPTDGSWIDVTVEYTVEETWNGETPRIYVSASQAVISSSYYQTYFDNLRVTLE